MGGAQDPLGQLGSTVCGVSVGRGPGLPGRGQHLWLLGRDAGGHRRVCSRVKVVMGGAVGLPGLSPQPTTVPHAGSGTRARLLTP